MVISHASEIPLSDLRFTLIKKRDNTSSYKISRTKSCPRGKWRKNLHTVECYVIFIFSKSAKKWNCTESSGLPFLTRLLFYKSLHKKKLKTCQNTHSIYWKCIGLALVYNRVPLLEKLCWMCRAGTNVTRKCENTY